LFWDYYYPPILGIITTPRFYSPPPHCNAFRNDITYTYRLYSKPKGGATAENFLKAEPGTPEYEINKRMSDEHFTPFIPVQWDSRE
jgi:hypothetical protein